MLMAEDHGRSDISDLINISFRLKGHNNEQYLELELEVEKIRNHSSKVLTNIITQSKSKM